MISTGHFKLSLVFKFLHQFTETLYLPCQGISYSLNLASNFLRCNGIADCVLYFVIRHSFGSACCYDFSFCATINVVSFSANSLYQTSR